MSRETIDFGIDLGTTNSAVARLVGRDVTIVKNNDNAEFTPSAVWVNKSGDVYVGRRAKERAEYDDANVAAEFKQQMGVDGAAKVFAVANRTMDSTALSSQVLMSLARDVDDRLGEPLDAAVITVPAAFELHQCEATRHAAELAGLRTAPLLQEPTAAAFAYSFGRPVDRAYWMVFDLGGGTFDASIISVRDGEFVVVNHAGDNFLGGKLIDWAIVEELLIPAVRSERDLADLGRGDPRWATNIGKLKLAAEQTKIELTRWEATAVSLDGLDDGAGGRFDVEITVRRGEVERLAEPLYRRAVNLCRKALEDAELAASAIDKLVLVGGATLAPHLRGMLADPAEGLGIPIDHSLDPVTVVARGAAIFAGTQRMPRSNVQLPAGGFELECKHDPIGVDLEPRVGGRVHGPAGQDWSGWGIEIVNDAVVPPWRSPRIGVGPQGTFRTTLFVPEASHSVFRVELFSAEGRRQPLGNDRLSYTHDPGAVPGEAVLTHSIGVGMANREMSWVLGKGDPLPKSGHVVLETIVDVRRAAGAGLIRIPIMEGDQRRADRNRQVGVMEITPRDIRRDVPAGSEVEISVEVDASRRLTALAYVPILDEEFPMQVDMRRPRPPERDTLRAGADAVRKRLAEVRDRAGATEAPRAGELIEVFDAEGTMQQIDRQVAAAEHSVDAGAAAEIAILRAEVALDEIEGELELPALQAEVDELLELVRGRVASDGDDTNRRDLRAVESEADSAKRAGDTLALRQACESLRDILRRLLDRTGELQVARFYGLVERCEDAGVTREMRRLITEGEEALRAGDIGRLGSVNARLYRMIPAEEVPVDDFSTLAERQRRGR